MFFNNKPKLWIGCPQVFACWLYFPYCLRKNPILGMGEVSHSSPDSDKPLFVPQFPHHTMRPWDATSASWMHFLEKQTNLGWGTGWIGFKCPGTTTSTCRFNSSWHGSCHPAPQLLTAWVLFLTPKSASLGPSPGFFPALTSRALLEAVCLQLLEVAVASPSHFPWTTSSLPLLPVPAQALLWDGTRLILSEWKAPCPSEAKLIIPWEESLVILNVLLIRLFSLHPRERLLISLNSLQLASLCMAVWGQGSFVPLFFLHRQTDFLLSSGWMSFQVFGGKQASQKALLLWQSVRAADREQAISCGWPAGEVRLLCWQGGWRGPMSRSGIHAHLPCVTLGNPLIFSGPHSDYLATRNLDLIWFTMFRTNVENSFELKAIETQ